MTKSTAPTLSVLAIFKNEATIIAEWVSHYLDQGAQQILLIDNNSNDDWRSALGSLGADGRVTCLEDPRQHAQLEIYRDILYSGMVEGEWLLTCDLDEFVYARQGFKSIADYLGNVDSDVSSIALPWKMFGSSGHHDHPAGRTVDNFLMRGSAHGRILGKSISRTSEIQRIEVHRHHCRRGRLIRSSGATITPDPFLEHREHLLEAEALHLNHYSVRSREFYDRVKRTRGSVFSQHSQNNLASDEYFRLRDLNDIRDAELSRRSPGCPPPATGHRAPVFRLLEPDAELRQPPEERATTLRWRLEGPSSPAVLTAVASRDANNLWIDGGRLPEDPEEVPSALAGLALAALMPLDRRQTIHIDATRATPAGIRRARAWCDLLQPALPIAWMRAVGIQTPRGPCLRCQPADWVDASTWRCVALALARNRRFQGYLQCSAPQGGVAIALPPRGAGRFERELRAPLRQLARRHGVTLIRLHRLPVAEQILQFRLHRWILGPFQPSMELVHSLDASIHPVARLILLSRGVRRNRLVLQRMRRTAAVPHRMLALPRAPAGNARAAADGAVLGDLLTWLKHQGGREGAADGQDGR